jgi:hypothetical protein
VTRLTLWRIDLLLAGRVVAVLFVALAQEAGQLGGKSVAGRKLAFLLLLERVDAALELLDVGRRLLVRGDRLADLLLVALCRLLELFDVDLEADQAAEPLAERNCRPRARRQRDVVRNRRPEARGRNVDLPARVVEDADDPGRALVATTRDPAAERGRDRSRCRSPARAACAGHRRAARQA